MVDFHALDYTVLLMTLTVYLGIGIYFGRKRQGSREYTSAGGQLGALPVGLSIAATNISVITVQGVPAEVYIYGAEFLLTVIGPWTGLLAIVSFLPLFLRLNIHTTYEYLQLRFRNKPLLILAYTVGIVSSTMYMGVTTFGPAAALESVTNIPTSVNIFIIVIVCTLYTAMGGIKAVIWTDTFQSVVMLAGLIAVIVVGIARLDDTTVYHEMQRRSRLDIHWSIDPTIRTSFWSLTIGSIFSWFGRSGNQPTLMRYRSVGSEKQAVRALLLGTTGISLFFVFACFAGAVVFAYYSHLGCGPLERGAVYSSNQVIPYFVADVLTLPGVPGLFIAAVIASTFSTVSSLQNANTAVIWQDIFSSYTRDMPDWKKTMLMKITVVVFGVLSCGVAFLSKAIGGPITVILAALMGLDAPIVAVYVIGASFPFIGAVSAVLGAIGGCITIITLVVGQYIVAPAWEKPPQINDTCDITDTMMNASLSATQNTWTKSAEEGAGVWTEIFRTSPYWFPAIGFSSTLLIALCCSAIPGLRRIGETPDKLLFPFVNKIRRTLRKAEVDPCDEDIVSESKADVLLKDCSDRENKGGTKVKTPGSVTVRRDDVMNNDGLQENTALTRHLTKDCSI